MTSKSKGTIIIIRTVGLVVNTLGNSVDQPGWIPGGGAEKGNSIFLLRSSEHFRWHFICSLEEEKNGYVARD